MKKLESTFKNMTLSLFVICLISSASLAFVYQMTRAESDLAAQAKSVEAIQSVALEGFDNNPVLEKMAVTLSGGDSVECYPAKKGGKLTSLVVKSSTKKGYSGLIELMVSFLPSGAIHKIVVLSQKETPGLGTKINESLFKEQFYGKNPESFKLAVKKDGGDVDAVTAATISSRAFCDAVQRAYEAFKKAKK